MRWLGWMAVGLVLLVVAQPVRAQTTNQAGLVIVHGDGRVVSRCVDFNEPQISGYDLLQRSGLDLNIEVNGVGVAICRVDGEGCTYPQQSCFCGTESDSSHYWSYWQWGNGAWQYSNQGAASQVVQPGAVQGWVWGVDTTNNAATPSLTMTFAEVCVPPTATPTVTPSPTATPTALATATLTPTLTLLPPTLTPTPWPTLPPTLTPTPWPTLTLLPVATATAPWTPTPAPPQIMLFSGNPLTLTAGETATLLWQVQNASQVLLRSASGENPIGPVGNLVVQPTQNSTYVLVARNSGGEVTATVDLIVALPAVPTDVQSAAALVAPTSLLPTPIVLATSAVSVLPTPTAAPTLSLAPIVTPTLPAVAAAPILTGTTPTAVLAALPTLQAVPSPVLVVASDPMATRLQLLTLLGGVVLVLVVPLGLLGLVALLWMVKQRS